MKIITLLALFSALATATPKAPYWQNPPCVGKPECAYTPSGQKICYCRNG